MMKKITLLFMLLAVSFGYAQTLPFDFEATLHGFIGDGGPVVTNGAGNDVLEITAGVADWDNAQVTFGSPIDLSDNANNTLKFTIQSTTAAPGEVHQHGVSFQDAGGGGAIEMNFQTVGQDLTNVQLNFEGIAAMTARDKMVIFTDVGNFGVQSGTGGQSGTPTAGLSGTYIIDNISLGADPAPTCSDGIQNGSETGVDCGGPDCGACLPTCSDGIMNGSETGVDCGGPDCGACPSPPTMAAPTPPARLANDVVSIFSGAYTDVAPSGVITFAGASFDNFTVDSADDTRRLTLVNPGGGAQYEYFGVSGALDLTDFTHVHIDFYVEGAVAPGQLFQVFLLNFPAYPDGVGSTNLNTSFDINALGSGSWISGDVELSTFGGNLTRDKIALVQVVGAGAPAFGPIYIQNIYFHKNTTLSVDDNELVSFKVYPNPTQDNWIVKSENQKISSIQVYDILGKQVLSLSPNDTEATINGSSLKSGLYFAQIETDNSLQSIKLVKN